MTIKKCFAVPVQSTFVDMALLFVRMVAGLAFVMHGWPKIQHPFTWMGPQAFAPGIFQALAALSEFGGGLGWMLGLLMPLSSFGIACTMVVAFAVHAFMRGDPFVSSTGGPTYELAAIYFCIALVLFATGPGRWSIDQKLFGRRAQ